MYQLCALVFFSFTTVNAVVYADKLPQPTGFGVADWGMDRNQIIAAEGQPSTVFDWDGSIYYRDRMVLEKSATIGYKFQEGCTSLKTFECIFSNGSYIFEDGSETFKDKLENTLTEKYGPPIKVEKTQQEIPGEYITQGKEVREYIEYIRYAGEVKIVHMWQVLLTSYTDSLTGDHKAGPVSNVIKYYGPYHYQIELNKNKSKDRGL